MSQITLFADFDPSSRRNVYPPYNYRGPYYPEFIKHDADLVVLKRAVWGTPLTPREISYAKRSMRPPVLGSRYRIIYNKF